MSKLLHFIIFADDTNLFYSCANIVDLVYTVNFELEKLSTWFRTNKLSLNVCKTNFIVFGRKTYSDKLLISIDGTVLDQFERTKFLGVFVDEQANWNTHIACVSTKISRGLGALARVRHILPRKSMLMLYYTLIYPHLSYCCIVWGCAADTNLKH